jgi:inner membrane transporter RhtA
MAMDRRRRIDESPPAMTQFPVARRLLDRTPPQAFFAVSALFHYLGPAFAVMLFATVAPLGVAWLRIASAALIFTVWRRPWVYWMRLSAADRWTVAALGAVLAAMNAVFYLAIARLPLATVGAIEFLGPIGLAFAGARSGRNVQALGLAAVGVAFLTHLSLQGAALGYLFAFANCALFVAYVVLGHRISGEGGIDRLRPRRRPARPDRPGAVGRRRRRGRLLVGDPLCD